MKHRLFAYTGLLGALLSLGTNQLHAGDVASVASNHHANTVARPASLDPVALRKLMHAPERNVIDPVDMSAGDWRGFTPLGNIVTQEMRAAGERAAAKATAEFEGNARAGLH